MFKKKSSIFNPSFFSDLTKKECTSAVITYLIYNIGLLFVIHLAMKRDMWILVTVSGVAYSILFFIIVVIQNKNKLHTLGLKRVNIKVTAAVFLLILLAALLKNMPLFSAHKISVVDFFINISLDLATLFFTEEFIYRGYLWPRLVLLLGKHKGTILCGVLWGIMHLINPATYETLNALAVLNAVLTGVSGQYLFLFFYSLSENIYFPTIIHTAPHFFNVNTTLRELAKALANIL
ncbi:CPBP family intramembrane glutamic endopeptidase [Lachnospiraceae bacterium 50-23]|jgi:membrane protease YdiL (CAAX protease family)|nr:CPBP family intramembrane metalloprotease [Dorea sp.]